VLEQLTPSALKLLVLALLVMEQYVLLVSGAVGVRVICSVSVGAVGAGAIGSVGAGSVGPGAVGDGAMTFIGVRTFGVRNVGVCAVLATVPVHLASEL
jgi:hypothetical protein